MNIRRFFSRLARLFRLSKVDEGARETSAKNNLEPVEIESPAPEPPASPPPETVVKQAPPRKKQPKPRPQQNKKQQRRPQAKRNREPKVDKKGFRVLNDRHDLHRLFGGEEEERKTGETDFARMFEESRDDVYQKRLMQDKKQAEHQIAPRIQKPPSVKIKTYPPPQKELDLHGYTGEEAGIATEHFIQDARRKGIQTLRIIVGKGLHSEGKAVLPDVVERKIIALKRNTYVIAYHWEKKDKRKSGAIIVYLA